MYVLVNNNRVINGPRAWNFRSFENTLKEELEIEYTLPVIKNDQEKIEINENTTIYFCVLDYPNYNTKIQWIHGPFWDFSSGIAVGTFEVLEKSVGDIKSNLKQIVADNRYKKEIFGTTVDIQGITIKLDTTRDSRNQFLQKYVLLEEGQTTDWKFPEGWFTLTKEEIKSIIAAQDIYVQNQFDWENSKNKEIDLLEIVEELDKVDLGYQDKIIR